jgi:hypothetical protein
VGPGAATAQGRLPKGARAEAMAFLEELLKDGPKLADHVLAEAAEREIRRGTLHRAKVSLGIRVEKQGGKPHGPWTWSLPADPKPDIVLFKKKTGTLKP